MGYAWVCVVSGCLARLRLTPTVTRPGAEREDVSKYRVRVRVCAKSCERIIYLDYATTVRFNPKIEPARVQPCLEWLCEC